MPHIVKSVSLFWRLVYHCSVKQKTPRIGVDIAEVTRFKRFIKTPGHHFLKKVFSPEELSYAHTHAEPAVHLTGFFAAKEAASKALGVVRYPFIELEVRHDAEGAPEIWHKGKKIKMSISITHTRSVAVAVALV